MLPRELLGNLLHQDGEFGLSLLGLYARLQPALDDQPIVTPLLQNVIRKGE